MCVHARVASPPCTVGRTMGPTTRTVGPAGVNLLAMGVLVSTLWQCLLSSPIKGRHQIFGFEALPAVGWMCCGGQLLISSSTTPACAACGCRDSRMIAQITHPERFYCLLTCSIARRADSLRGKRWKRTYTNQSVV
jgi:hypothetical protein